MDAARVLRIEIDKDEVFLATSLHDELNRTNTTAALSIRHGLTPLTTINVDLAREQDRFEFSPLRDSDSTRIGIGVSFDRFAVVSGTAQVGFHDFARLVPDLPGYSSVTTRADLTYVALGSTRLAIQTE